MAKLVKIQEAEHYESPILPYLKEMNEKRGAKAVKKYVEAIKKISKARIKKIS